MHPWAAFIIGLIGGLTYSVWSRVIIHLKMDDPVDAVAGVDEYGQMRCDADACIVHLGAGSWGLFARPIFDPGFGILYHMVSVKLSAFETRTDYPMAECSVVEVFCVESRWASVDIFVDWLLLCGIVYCSQGKSKSY